MGVEELSVLSRSSVNLIRARALFTVFCLRHTRKEDTVLDRLHIGHSHLAHSFILRKKEAPVCVACNAVITVKHTLIECADLLEIKKKYFEEISLYSLFRNVIPEIIFDFLREIDVFYKI